MRRTYPRTPSEVTARRIDAALSTGRPRPVDGSGARAMALLALAGEDCGDRLWARRAVARDSMLAAHGCTGRRCPCGAHQADKVTRDELLDALGLSSAGELPGEGSGDAGMRHGPRDPEPTAAMVLMRQRLTTLRAVWVTECAPGTTAGKAAAVMTREQLVAAILDVRERR